MLPNILLIVLDALRFDHMSCYGHSHQTTPNIDVLANEGVIYERAYATSGWSLPSHASMFTGLYASKHGAHDEYHFLSNRYVTIAELLSGIGYQTSYFCNNPWVGTGFGVSRGFQHIEDTWPRGSGIKKKLRRGLNKIRKVVTNTNDGGAYQITKFALRWLKNQQSADQPFFTFVHYNEPHLPHKMQRILQRTFTDGTSLLSALKVNQDADAYIAGSADMTEEDFRVLKTIYDSQIHYADRYVKKIIEYLRTRGKIDDTVIMITADHGENFGEHGLMGHKLCLYESLIHVPLIIRYPTSFTPGTREQRLVQHVDLFPTLLDVLGLQAPDVRAELQGQSLIKDSGVGHPHVFAEQAMPSLKAFHKYTLFDPTPYNHRLKVVYDGEYKYIWASDGKHELYDIQVDPTELVNVITQKTEKADALQAVLDEWLGTFELSIPTENQPRVNPAVIDRLAGLGYIK